MPFTFTMPKLSPTMEEGTITKWLKKEGEFVEAGEVLIEVATDKATVEHAALDEGWLRKILVEPGKSATVNQPIAIFSENKEDSIEAFLKKEEPVKKEEKRAEVQKSEGTSKVSRAEPLFVPEPPLEDYRFETIEHDSRLKISPLAKKIAEEKNLDVTSVKGSGPEGRITKEDLFAAHPKGKIPFGPLPPPSEKAGSYQEIPLSPMRKIIGRRLQESKSFIPHFYIKQVIDAEQLDHVHQEIKKVGLKVTVNDLIIRAVALALRLHPEINTGYNSQTESIIQFKTVDVAVAVAFETGLITPIIRFADHKRVQQISMEIRELAQRGKMGKLKESEYKGGSFTVSNLGMYKISGFQAVINPPQAAILAVGGIESVPVVREGAVVPGKAMTMILSCDHRVIDGAQGARFLKTLQELLENPISLTL
jgi:pyruvate dehydrogenase E2 component (dihydrolipoamide acetyltransferase)